MPAVRTPEASQPTRRIAVSGCSLPRREIGSATSITFDFGANPPFTCVPACNLSVYASQWLLPDTTQDSIHGCLAQALPWPPFQTAELNALARRNPPQTGHEFFNLIRLSSARSSYAIRIDHGGCPDGMVRIDGQNCFGCCHFGYLHTWSSSTCGPSPCGRLSRPRTTMEALSP